MKGNSLILTYSWRLVKREWRRFILPLLSLSITAVVMTLVLLLTNASSLLLSDQARELLGGDVVLESNSPLNSGAIWETAMVSPEVESAQISFSGTLQSGSNTAPFSIQVVDKDYPIYGQFVMETGRYEYLAENEIYLDVAGAEKLGAEVGDPVNFGESGFRVAGIIVSEPTSLFGGFRFLPRAIINHSGFSASAVDPQLLRAEYSYFAKLPNLTSADLTRLRAVEEQAGREYDIDIAGQDQRGLQFGLETVTDFLVVAVLITAVLSAVNVYASTLYLVTVERKSLAVLLALGMTKRRLVALLGTALFYVVILASLIGIFFGIGIFSILENYIANTYLINLPAPDFVIYSLVSVSLIVVIAISSFVPAVRQSLALNPKQILIGGGDSKNERPSLSSLFLITLSTLLPLVLLASFLLDSIPRGLLVIGSVVLGYVVIAGLFALGLSYVYRRRHNFSFKLRSVISQKKDDGLFGIVSFTSLFVALTALGTLALLQISLERYLTNDLSQTVPSTYVLDIQPSQKDQVAEAFPDLNLFANIPARIVSIDDLEIRDELANRNPEVDRELGREFNITYGTELPPGDAISAGQWSEGRPGEISVDQDFAERANVKLGSQIAFTIQGFPVSGVVTSLRQTDSRSGLPFFYFILSPEDVKDFPGVFFGYSYYDEARQDELGRFLAADFPNISVIETQNIGPLVIRIVGTLLVMVLVVTLPPLLIATLLIATLVVSSYSSRRREGARLRALGSTKSVVLKQYLAETVSLTLFSAVTSYLFSVLIAYIVGIYFLKLEQVAIFDLNLLIGLSIVIAFVGLIGLYLFKTDTMPLRELLAYESNQ